MSAGPARHGQSISDIQLIPEFKSKPFQREASTWLSALPLQPLVSLDMLIVPCIEIRYIKYRVTRGRYCVVVYWDRLELIRLQIIKRLQRIKCQIWPLGSGIQGFVSEGAFDSLEEIDQRSKSNGEGFTITEVLKMSGMCTSWYHSVKVSGERFGEVILELAKRSPGTPMAWLVASIILSPLNRNRGLYLVYSCVCSWIESWTTTVVYIIS
jgi:hypothetical protein